MSNDKQSFIWDMVEHAWDIAAVASLVSHVAGPIGRKIGLSIPEFDVDKDKGEVKKTPSFEATRDSTRDEGAWNILLNNALSTEGADRVSGWYRWEFSFTRTDDWRKVLKALDKGESFRVCILDMDKPASKIGEERTVESETTKGKTTERVTKVVDIYGDSINNAAAFLKDLDRRIIRAYKHVTGESKVAPYRLWSEDVKKEAFTIISRENIARSLPHMPSEDEPHWSDHLSEAAAMLKVIGSNTYGWSQRKLDRATRTARAKNYLALRKQRARKQKQTGIFARLCERLIRSM